MCSIVELRYEPNCVSRFVINLLHMQSCFSYKRVSYDYKAVTQRRRVVTQSVDTKRPFGQCSVVTYVSTLAHSTYTCLPYLRVACDELLNS
jgi:hypothetical protein